MQSFNILLLLFMCQCVFTYAQTANKFFRKDYKFLESTNSFYKIHTIHKNWKDAGAMCELEGASLLYPENRKEARAVAKLLTDEQPFWWLYVGAISDSNSVFKTIDGVPVTDKYSKWASGEPDGDNVQNCVVLTREATLKDVDCTIIYPFVCKKALSALEWNTPCNMPKQDTQSTPKFFRSDYTYVESTNSLYKLHKIYTHDWDEARKECAAEDATLFYPEDKHEVEVVSEIVKNSHTSRKWRIFVGASSHFARGIYESIDGVPEIDLYVNWASGEPSARNDKDCMVLIHDGTFRDVACDTHAHYVCKKTRPNLATNPVEMVKQDYEYNEAAGRCYKFHLNPTTWSNAYAICAAEQSYLAIIDSDVEADVLLNLTARASTNKVAGKYLKEIVHLGFHNLDDEGWSTTKGVRIADSGYSRSSQWAPNADTRETSRCGAMDFKGQLNDISCNSESFFICEHEIKKSEGTIEEATN